ncbi:MAG: hypothetical protein GY899_16325 [Verrucomicrobiaceae bacterium]|nr:hypothetical protein [Verrucomicrobiaceae bacterium]
MPEPFEGSLRLPKGLPLMGEGHAMSQSRDVPKIEGDLRLLNMLLFARMVRMPSPAIIS